MKKYTVNAIVLRNINYQDSHKIYTLLTSDNGKISAIARGVRKISSRRAGSLDTINLIKAEITEDSKGFKTLTEVQTINSFKKIKDKLELALTALYLADLINVFVPQDTYISEISSGNGLFELFNTSLFKLNTNKSLTDRFAIIANFEFQLIRIAGFGLTVDRCVNCQRSLNDSWNNYGFSYDDGGLFCDNCVLGGFRIDEKVAFALFDISGSYNYTISQSHQKASQIVRKQVLDVAQNYFRPSKFSHLLQP